MEKLKQQAEENLNKVIKLSYTRKNHKDPMLRSGMINKVETKGILFNLSQSTKRLYIKWEEINEIII